MSKYTITFEKAATKFLKKQNAKLQNSILTAISELPNGTDIKKLKGHKLYRMRVSSVRVIVVNSKGTNSTNHIRKFTHTFCSP